MVKNCLLTPRIHKYWRNSDGECAVLTPVPISINGIEKPWTLIHTISGNRYYQPMEYEMLEAKMLYPNTRFETDYGWEKCNLHDIMEDCVERSSEVRGFTFRHNNETIMQVTVDSCIRGLLSLERAQYIDIHQLSPAQNFEWDIYRQRALMS